MNFERYNFATTQSTSPLDYAWCIVSCSKNNKVNVTAWVILSNFYNEK